MKNFHITIRVILIFTVICICGGLLHAQSAKPKPTPKSKATSGKAPAAANSSLSPLESEIWAEIGNLRANPAAYIAYLEQLKASFKGTTATLSDGSKLITSEGAAAVDDAIKFLKTVKPVKRFDLSPGLTKAARDHLEDMVKKDFSGHKGSDASWPPNRVERYGSWGLEVKENISYHSQSARNIVLTMLVDDAYPKRDHRKNLLSSNLRFAGLSAGEGKTYGRICVVVFTGEFTEKRTGK